MKYYSLLALVLGVFFIAGSTSLEARSRFNFGVSLNLGPAIVAPSPVYYVAPQPMPYYYVAPQPVVPLAPLAYPCPQPYYYY